MPNTMGLCPIVLSSDQGPWKITIAPGSRVRVGRREGDKVRLWAVTFGVQGVAGGLEAP